jgi:RNA polymerase sigma factor (sigma-70 family)
LNLSKSYTKGTKLDDQEIIEGFRTSDRQVLRIIYDEYFQHIYLNIVKGELLGIDDARDIFHEALIIIRNNLKKDSFRIEHSFNTYLSSICKKLVLKELREKYKMHNTCISNIEEITEEDKESLSIDPEKSDKEELIYQLISKHFNLLKEDCKKVLLLTSTEHSYDEIAQIIGYKKGTYTKSKKNRCKEYLIRSIKEDKLYNELESE